MALYFPFPPTVPRVDHSPPQDIVSHSGPICSPRPHSVADIRGAARNGPWIRGCDGDTESQGALLLKRRSRGQENPTITCSKPLGDGRAFYIFNAELAASTFLFRDLHSDV